MLGMCCLLASWWFVLTSEPVVHCPLPDPSEPLIVAASSLVRGSVVVVKHFDQKELEKERFTKAYTSLGAPPAVHQRCHRTEA